jgi:hypothetical protein
MSFAFPDWIANNGCTGRPFHYMQPTLNAFPEYPAASIFTFRKRRYWKRVMVFTEKIAQLKRRF